MPIATILFATALVWPQAKAEYRDPKLGLLFEYPKTWKLRRDRYSAVFDIPIAEGRTATVQVYNAKFKDTADDWQLIQLEINRSMKRTVDRQWQEEYLGVPLLLTRISYAEADKSLTGIIGLLYTNYIEKLHFRLTSPAEGADEAENAWRQAMLTLRTVSGDLPAVENPDRPADKPVAPVPTTVWKKGDKAKKPERGSTIAELTANETKFKLNLPKGWKVDNTKLVGDGIGGSLTVTVTIGAPDEAGRHLLDLAKDSLGQFKSVTLREDPVPKELPSGAVVGRVFRTGTGEAGPLVVGAAVGYCEGTYWTVEYRATDVKAYQRDKAALDDLFRLLYVERA